MIHVIVSVGWLGAALVFVALSIAGLTLKDERSVRAVYLSMRLAAQYAMLPLAFASLLSGIVQSLGTQWGLLQHYWVVFKLGINLLATIILLMYGETFAAMAAAASDPNVPLAAIRNPSPLVHATLGVIALVVAVVLAIYKPKGVTPFARQRQSAV